ncbi:hypothetical protein ACJX0J_019297 [Zea mays]
MVDKRYIDYNDYSNSEDALEGFKNKSAQHRDGVVPSDIESDLHRAVGELWKVAQYKEEMLVEEKKSHGMYLINTIPHYYHNNNFKLSTKFPVLVFPVVYTIISVLVYIFVGLLEIAQLHVDISNLYLVDYYGQLSPSLYMIGYTTSISKLIQITHISISRLRNNMYNMLWRDEETLNELNNLGRIFIYSVAKNNKPGNLFMVVNIVNRYCIERKFSNHMLWHAQSPLYRKQEQ